MSNLIDGLALVVALGSAVVSCLSAGAAKASADAAKISAEETEKQRKISQYTVLAPHFVGVSRILSALTDGAATPNQMLEARDSFDLLRAALPYNDNLITVLDELDARFSLTTPDFSKSLLNSLQNNTGKSCEQEFHNYAWDHLVGQEGYKLHLKTEDLKRLMTQIRNTYISLDDAP